MPDTFQTQANRWWEQEENRPAQTIFNLLRHWDQTQGAIQASNLRNMRLYANREVQSLSIAQYVLSASQDYMAGGLFGGAFWNRPNRITLNVVKSCIDTLYSKLGKNKIKPTFMTTGGRIRSRQKARQLNKAIFGMLWNCDAYNIAAMALKDAFIFGTGFVKILRDKNNRIILERIFPDEIAIDPADGYYGKPRNLFNRKFVSRDYLIELFPEYKTEIMSVRQTDISFTGAAQDTILVCEAWHLGEDGKHVIAIDGFTLLNEDYLEEDYPIAIIKYSESSIGFFGTGVAEDLLGIQVEINRILLHIQESMRLISHPRIFIESGSKVNTRHITNEIGTIIPYTGNPPIINIPPSVGEENFRQLENLYQKAFQIVGVSALSAQSQKPAGLNSGAALREYNDIETERFARTAQQFEQFIIDIAHKIINELDKTPNYEISTQSKDGLERVKWKDIRLPRNDYILHCFPTSAMPQTPALRLQWVQEMLQSGFIDLSSALDLLDFPDLDSYNQITLAPIRLIHKMIEDIIFEEKYVAPEPFFDLNNCKKWGQHYYAWCLTESDTVSEKSLDMLRTWIDDCNALIAQAQIKAQQTLPPTMAELGMPGLQQMLQQQPVPNMQQ